MPSKPANDVFIPWGSGYVRILNEADTYAELKRRAAAKRRLKFPAVPPPKPD